MSDFWSRKLGNNPAPQQAQPQQQAVPSQGPWWQQGQVPQRAQPVPFQQGQIVQDPQGNQYLVQNGQLVPMQQQQDELAGRKLPKSAGQKETCPECGSPDYSITGKGFNKNSGSFDVWKCFDCGYPVKQEFSGMTDVTGAAAGGATKQVAYGGITNQFAPQQTQAPAFAAEQGGPGR